MSVNHQSYQGTNGNSSSNAMNNPFYAPIDPVSNYEQNVPGAYASPQNVTESKMSSLQRAMSRKKDPNAKVQSRPRKLLQTPSPQSVGRNSLDNNSRNKYNSYNGKTNSYSNAAGHSYTLGGSNSGSSGHSYTIGGNTNSSTSSHSYTIGGNKSTPSYSYTIGSKNTPQKSSSYSYTIGSNNNASSHSYTVGASNNTPSNTSKYSFTVGSTNSVSRNSSNSSINSNYSNRGRVYSKKQNYNQSEEASIHDAFEQMNTKTKPSISKSTIKTYSTPKKVDDNLSLYETTPSITSAGTFKGTSKSDASTKISALEAEIAKLKTENANLAAKLESMEDEEHLKMMEASERTLNMLKASSSPSTSNKAEIEKKKEMEKQISDLTKELNQTKQELTQVKQYIQSMEKDQLSLQRSHDNTTYDFQSNLSELKEIQEASKNIQTTMEAFEEERVQLMELLNKQKFNIELIGKEQYRMVQYCTKQESFTKNSIQHQQSMDLLLGKQKVAMEKILATTVKS